MTFLYGYLASMEAWGREAEKYNRVVVMNSQGFDGQVPLKMLDEVREMDGVVAAVPFSWYGGKYGDGTEFFAQFGTDPERVFDVWSELKIPPDQLAEFKTNKQACVVDRGLGPAAGPEDRRPRPAPGHVLSVQPRSETGGHLRAAGDDAQPVLQPEVPGRGPASEGGGRGAGNCGTIFFKARSAEIIPELCEQIDQHYASSANPTNTQTEKAFSQMFVKMAGNVQNFILFIAVFVTISLTLVAANGMAMSMRERTTEIAVLKAIGFQTARCSG